MLNGQVAHGAREGSAYLRPVASDSILNQSESDSLLFWMYLQRKRRGGGEGIGKGLAGGAMPRSPGGTRAAGLL